MYFLQPSLQVHLLLCHGLLQWLQLVPLLEQAHKCCIRLARCLIQILHPMTLIPALSTTSRLDTQRRAFFHYVCMIGPFCCVTDCNCSHLFFSFNGVTIRRMFRFLLDFLACILSALSVSTCMLRTCLLCFIVKHLPWLSVSIYGLFALCLSTNKYFIYFSVLFFLCCGDKCAVN